jgi:GrpB-like predicted nucleotidyltransferase (UPF0157 family)/GNAT superfamily N-acetyltransferase
MFPEFFQKERERIASNVNQRLIIEHIGSTAVPGLGGKGIIDIAIAVGKEEMDSVSKQLQAIGYEFRPTFSTPDRLYLITYLADPEEEMRRYHIHLTYPENKEWKEFLGFRDYLRSHPREAQDYAELKKQAAFEANEEGEKYRKLKEPIFRKIKAEDQSQAEDTVIRIMEKEDIPALINNFTFPWSSIQATTDKWTRYSHEHQKQIRTVYLVEKERKIIGYASLLRISKYPHFKRATIPEIHDMWIAQNWRNKGFGKRLIQHLEHSARAEGYQKMGIGVGLYADYGPAQQLYCRLGYSPDGYGVTYNYQPTVPGESYSLDDELLLWMTKNLS